MFTRSATLHTGTHAAPARHALAVRLADTPWRRFRGLMLCPPLATEPCPQALLITRCPSVHGFFMRYALDVVYLARTALNVGDDEARFTVTHTAHLRPWCASVGRSRSAHALEMPAGSIARLQIRPGHELRLHRRLGPDIVN
jgi:hypothetical protein